ncbi:hypothetical protein GF337_04240 [candidate division KSB1 bacterium]|nr:hypothetical protein [candidate division KSB1 bacterium]
MSSIDIIKAETRKQLRTFVKFPWTVYKNDKNWVPPLIASQIEKLDSNNGVFFQQGDAEAFMAFRDGKIAGTIVPWINHRSNAFKDEKTAGFGYFESIDDFDVCRKLLDTACNWANRRGAEVIRGPLCFSPQDSPGVLISGFDISPVPMVSHTPRYYAPFLEEYGFEKHRDAYAYKIDLTHFKNDIKNLPPKLLNVAEGVQQRYDIKIRNLKMEEWDDELKSGLYIFNEALGFQREGVPMDESEFRKLASDLKPIVDPKLVFFATVNEQPVGLYVAIPNVNQVLQHVNGKLFPTGWLKLLMASKYITMISTKILGVLEEYRNKGVDALFYVKIAEEAMKRGHKWIDYSLVAEENKMANRIVRRLGGTIYKTCRTYKMDL